MIRISVIIDQRKEAYEDGFQKQVQRTLDSPIAVFRGCTTDAGAVARPLHCNADGPEHEGKGATPNLSWVLQIGGHVTPLAADIPMDKKYLEFQQRLDAAEQTLNAATAELESTDETLDKLLEELGKAEGNEKTQLQEQVDEAKRKQMAQDTIATQARLELLQLGVQMTSDSRGDSGYSVSGGLILPFYLIVLSLVGGAVSLTRRIPEFQKQAAPSYVGTENAPALTPLMLREYLVFQIVQFISAPFIAAVAYYVLEPDTTATTVGLAFAAGFASETVLIWVRAVVDKLRPDTNPIPPTGSLAGTIASLKGKSAQYIEKTVTIGVVGQATLVSVFSDGGLFVIDGVPEGAHALEVSYKPDDPKDTRFWCRRFEIQAGKTRSVSVDFDSPATEVPSQDDE